MIISSESVAFYAHAVVIPTVSELTGLSRCLFLLGVDD